MLTRFSPERRIVSAQQEPSVVCFAGRTRKWECKKMPRPSSCVQRRIWVLMGCFGGLQFRGNEATLVLLVVVRPGGHGGRRFGDGVAGVSIHGGFRARAGVELEIMHVKPRCHASRHASDVLHPL